MSWPWIIGFLAIGALFSIQMAMLIGVVRHCKHQMLPTLFVISGCLLSMVKFGIPLGTMVLGEIPRSSVFTITPEDQRNVASRVARWSAVDAGAWMLFGLAALTVRPKSEALRSAAGSAIQST